MSFLDDLASYYDHEADKFHHTRQRHWPEFDVLVEEIKAHFPKKKTLHILEIGCGSGRLYAHLCKALPTKTLSYTGIDISKNLIQKAKADYPDATWKVGNMTEFLHGVKQEGYDLIIGIASFHHLPSSRMRITTANHIYRALAYDGICFLTNRSNSERFSKRFRKSIVSAWLKSIFSLGIYRPNDLFLPWKNDTHKKVFHRYYHIFAPQELTNIAKISGFGVIEQFYITSEGERTPDKQHSRNFCSIWEKTVFLDK